MAIRRHSNGIYAQFTRSSLAGCIYSPSGEPVPGPTPGPEPDQPDVEYVYNLYDVSGDTPVLFRADIDPTLYTHNPYCETLELVSYNSTYKAISQGLKISREGKLYATIFEQIGSQYVETDDTRLLDDNTDWTYVSGFLHSGLAIRDGEVYKISWDKDGGHHTLRKISSSNRYRKAFVGFFFTSDIGLRNDVGYLYNLSKDQRVITYDRYVYDMSSHSLLLCINSIWDVLTRYVCTISEDLDGNFSVTVKLNTSKKINDISGLSGANLALSSEGYLYKNFSLYNTWTCWVQLTDSPYYAIAKEPRHIYG